MLQHIAIQLRGRIKSERGASAVEYGLLVALIAVAIILAVTALGTTLKDTFNGVVTDLGGTAG